MRRVLFAVVLISLVAALAGCGGSSSVNHLDPTIPILGSWQPISGTENGAPVPMSTAMNWDATWTRGILQFTDTDQCHLLGYKQVLNGDNLELSHDKTINGTWTSAPGVATITLDGVTTAISYVIVGNLLTATFSRGGKDYVVTWVRVVDLPERDTLIGGLPPVPPDTTVGIKKWQAASITTVAAGADTLTTYFGMGHDTNTIELTLKSDGTATIVEKGTAPLAGVKNGRWFTGDGEFALSLFTDTPVPPADAKTVFSSETRGFYTVGAQLTTTFLDVKTGKTVVIAWDSL